ncbi:hypothetical protein [Massilia aquatica]|uniref:Uncharacterized protein n=1 Tax=Massilia aquatica TaxID=2609000 RepID=A0ABX0MJT4_9BURK|nr:hypothetical protein [Massilia aquatica]NHZ44670.1 hypothetical protein [Massilia aquatica]
MKLENAEFLTKVFLQVSADLNSVVYDDRADSGEHDPDYLKLRRGIGEVLGVLYSEVMVKVFKDFPDLTPAMLRDDYEDDEND